MHPRHTGPVTVRGETFESAAACAAHFSIARRSVLKAIKNGNPDSIAATLVRNIVIRGVTYRTAQEAADALGVTREHVCIAARTGKLELVGLRGRGRGMPICIRGVTYKNAHEAAAAFGINTSSIFQALYRGGIDRVGLKTTGVANRKPFTLFGMSWPSRAAASRALGFGDTYISRAYTLKSPSKIAAIEAAVMQLQMRKTAEAWRRRQEASDRVAIPRARQ